VVLVKRFGLIAALILMALPSFAARRRALTPPGDPCSPGVIAAPYFSSELTIDGGYVYFTDDVGGLFRAPKGGGVVTTLFTFTDNEVVQLIVVDGETLFFGTLDSSQTMGTIYSMPKTGGTPTMIVSGILTLNEMVVDDSNIYWVSFGTPNATFTLFLADARIEKATKSGANRVTLVGNLSEPIGIAVDSTTVYFTETGAGLGSTSAGLRSVPKNGGSVARMTNGTATIALVASSTDLYFSTFNGNSGVGTIQRMSKSGGTATTIEQTTGLLTQAIRLTSDKLYAHFATNSTEGIRSIPLSGGAATHVVDSELDTPRFAVDSCSVFYVTIADSIERKPR
jgi:uncharacterized repeat protein (TIGR03803 family)